MDTPEPAQLRSWTVDEYNNDMKYVRSTELKQFIGKHGPAEYWAHKTGLVPPKDDARHLEFGTLLHTLIFEGRQDFIECASAKHTKKAKALREATGKITVSPLVAAKLFGCADALARCREAMDLIEGSIYEQTITWESHGVLQKCRLDIVKPLLVLADLKSTGYDDRRGFWKVAVDKKYGLSAAMYCAGAKLKFSSNPRWYYISVYTDPPHWVYVHELHEQMIEIGQSQYEEALTLYRECHDRLAELPPERHFEAFPDTQAKDRVYVPEQWYLDEENYAARTSQYGHSY